MTCEALDQRLDDWVDGALPEGQRGEIEAHLASCPECRERERRLRQLLAHAAALSRSVSPSRDLWPEIAERIERERAWSWARLGGWQPAMLAAAAAVIVALAGVFLYQRAPAPVHTVVIPSPKAGPQGTSFEVLPVAVGIDPALVAMERDYQVAANALLAALQERKHELEPDTLASVERNLAVIDEALAEVHRALAKDPTSPELGRMLASTHRKRVDVLRKMVRLTTTL